MKGFLLVVNLFAALISCGQSVFKSLRTSSSILGASALSTDSISVRSLRLNYPVYDFICDTINDQLIFSCRQPGDGTTTYLNKGGFASLGYDEDTLIWQNETALFDLKVGGPVLLASSDEKSVAYNRKLGYDFARFPVRLVYMTEDGKYGLYYQDPQSDVLTCADVISGTVHWSASIPRDENWSDIKPLNDSVLLIVAGGLYAVDLRTGVLWSHRFSTSANVNGSLVYSPVLHKSISALGNGVTTSTNEKLITQLTSNILIQQNQIYIATRESLSAFDMNGGVIWKTDLKDYDPSKMWLSSSEHSLLLVNLGIGVHAENFVVRDQPFVLMLNSTNGEIVDQFGLSETKYLIDFMISSKGLSFGGKDTIVEISNEGQLKKKIIPLDVQKYGFFRNFVNGDSYFILKEGFYVPLNFINDQLIYFSADNNKIYGINNEELIYEYHFSELMKMFAKTPNVRILAGLKETFVTTRNFELMAEIQLSSPKLLLKDKLYFFDKEFIRVLDLRKIK